MLAVDTNVIVRYLTVDHAEQYARAVALIEHNDVFVSKTVLLETEWVLRTIYAYERDRISAQLMAFASLPGVRVEDPTQTLNALSWFKDGFDFADAMHVASAEGCEALISFDKRLAKIAVRVEGLTVRAP